MTITGGTALGKDEIDRMMKDAEAHAEEDRQRREEAEIRNNADTLVFQTEKLLKEQGDKVEPAEREKIDAALKALKDALAGTDVDAVKRAHEGLIVGEPGVRAAALRVGVGAAERGRRQAVRVPVRATPPPTTTRSPTPRSSTRARRRAPDRGPGPTTHDDGRRRRRHRDVGTRRRPTALLEGRPGAPDG